MRKRIVDCNMFDLALTIVEKVWCRVLHIEQADVSKAFIGVSMQTKKVNMPILAECNVANDKCGGSSGKHDQ